MDKKYLSFRPVVASSVSIDFSKVIVKKPWGQEYLAYKSPTAEVWHLAISQHNGTSMHCHPNKRTSLVILEGRALFSSLNRSIELKPRDAVIISKGAFHSTQAISKGGIKVLEFESPPMKYDLVRLEDKYGRANKGYEGLKNMQTVSGTSCRFSDDDCGKVKKFSQNHLCIHQLSNRKDFMSIRDEKSAIMVILKGSVLDQYGKKICSVGDVVPANFLISRGNIFKNVSILSIHPI